MNKKTHLKKKALFPDNLNNFLGSDEAVSEVLDFITIVGILILSLSLIGVAGYPVLKSTQETRYIENTRQTFVVMAENINKVVMGQTPSQNIEVKMYGGELSVRGDSTINITANSTNQTTKVIERIVLVDQQMRSIENTVGDTVVAYEGTGVWVKYPNGFVYNSYKPLITNVGNVIVIPVVKIGGLSSSAGSGMSRIKAKGVPGITYYPNVSDLRVNINSSYKGNSQVSRKNGWEGYFESMTDWKVSVGDTSYLAGLNTSSNVDVYILNVQMDVVVE
jgi:hypothetical protein